ncbi:MAG: SLBB domain-containing protein [Myxococcota bacterium]|nr:SLBB domain-containing protein [Myxococcota bacterium]
MMKDVPVGPRNLRCMLMIQAALVLACGNATRNIKEGDVEDLLSPTKTPENVPLASQSLMVEKIETTLHPQKDTYRIGPNDVLNISVLGHEEVSSTRDFNRGIVGTVVKKDGNIYLPIVGKVQAVGFTVEAFHDILRDHLKTYINDPQFVVDVLQYESQKFYILGEVKSPGAFPVDGDTSLLEAIGLAGGVNPEGSLERAYVVRDRRLLPINLADLLLRGDTSRNIFMRHQDLVYVPSAQDQRVYVLGEVRDPRSVQIPNARLSLAQALAEAGGILHVDADKGSIKLIRGSWQEPVVYTLDYEMVLANGDRIFLEPGDRIFVQPTSLTTASRYMQQILPFLQAADAATAIYDRLAD